MSAPNNSTLSFKEKFGYASGDFASNLYWSIFMNFMAYFYTDVFGISASALATMIFITRTWDWINDPIMGVIADRTKSRWGKYRPWLLWMLGPWIIFGILTFTALDLSATGKLIYAYATYTTLTMIYTAINIPYSAMLGVMTPHSAERTTLASWRFVGAFAGSFIVSSTMLYLVNKFGGGNEKLGFTLTVALYGIVSAAFFFVTFITTRERVQTPPGDQSSIRKDLATLRHNGPWMVMIAVSVLTILWIAVRGGATIHYFKYVCGSEHYGSLFLSIAMVAQIFGVLVTRRIVAFLGGKKRTYLILNLVAGVLIAAFYFIPTDNIPLVMIHQGVSSFLTAPLMPLFWSMIADTADYGAVKLGHRSTGLLFSAGTFSQKIGWSIGPAVAMYLLGYYGFVANQSQSPETVQGLRLLMSWIPAAFAFLTAGAVLLYKIDGKMEQEMEAAIAAQKTQAT
jgi:GPH family glycoside/pentoside/hexuronide:cation symporter